MNLNDVIFTDSLRKLDLHGYDRETARVMINDFILENYKMGIAIFVVVHGKGNGIVKKTTFETLKNNKKVLEYKIDYFNDGMTLVKISLT